MKRLKYSDDADENEFETVLTVLFNTEVSLLIAVIELFRMVVEINEGATVERV